MRCTCSFGRGAQPQDDGGVNEECVISACDNMAFVKTLPCIAELMADAKKGCPYAGAKEAYILDFRDRQKVL